MRALAKSLIVALSIAGSPALADCFDETLLVSRYHYPNPGSVGVNFQDLYLLNFPPLPQTLPSVTRLSAGFNAPTRYDSLDAAFSVDGSRIVFVSNRDNASTDIYVMDSADTNNDSQGDNLVRVTSDNVERFGLSWGPAGRLTYVSEPASYQTATAILTPAGALGSETTLTAHSGETSPPTLDATGAHVIAVFEETPFPNRTHSLNHVSSSGGQVTQLIYDGVVNQSPSLHPNNQTVFFTSSREGGKMDVFQAAINLSTTPPTLGSLTNVTQTPNLSESDVKVSPDGNCIAYLASDLTSNYGPNSDLYISDLAAQVTKRVTSTRDIGSFDWAPPGYIAAANTNAIKNKNASTEVAAVQCTKFDVAEVEKININGVHAYLHSAKVVGGVTAYERCTTDIPPFINCALTQVSGTESTGSCEVRPTKGLINAGRWSLKLKNASSANELTCTMTCFAR